MEYLFNPLIYHPTFGSHSPVLHLRPGDSISTFLPDAHGFDPQGNRLVEFSNPLVGPFFIDGLIPGDTLSVTLDGVMPNSQKGWSYLYPTAATLEPALFATIPATRKMITWDIDIEKGTARFCQSDDEQTSFDIPLQPMVGCLGVAPALSQAITSYASGNFGGNMDCPLLTAGCRVDFPVFVEGGLLFIGDCHAAQSHGEITGAAIEIPGDVHFSVDVKKNQRIGWPHGENGDSIFTIGSGRPLDLALQHATSEMLRWLMSDYRLQQERAALLMSQSVRYTISNAVNELATVACMLPKNLLGL